MTWRDVLADGYRMGQKPRSVRQHAIKGAFDGVLLGMLIWGFGPFWLRVLYCLAAWLLYGAVGSSDRFVGRL